MNSWFWVVMVVGYEVIAAPMRPDALWSEAAWFVCRWRRLARIFGASISKAMKCIFMAERVDREGAGAGSPSNASVCPSGIRKERGGKKEGSWQGEKQGSSRRVIPLPPRRHYGSQDATTPQSTCRSDLVCSLLREHALFSCTWTPTSGRITAFSRQITIQPPV